MSKPLLEMKGVRFAYADGPPVLDGLDFSLAEGDRVGILGPNGAGKSTLFLLAMGLVKPQAGEVWALGKRRAEEADFPPVRASLGFCFQDPEDQLFSPTVLEDVAFGPLNQGKSRGEAVRIARETLARLGLTAFEERVTWNLSGGEKRLVSLATVLAMRPQALLLDEPTTGLDETTQARLEQVLLASGLAWAIISHDHAFLARTCRRLLRLDQGRLAPL
jgi:cobalt/nickel transport system ATP-binding protein